MIKTFLLCLKVISGLKSSKKRKLDCIELAPESIFKIIKLAEFPFLENHKIIKIFYGDLHYSIILQKAYNYKNYNLFDELKSKFEYEDFYHFLKKNKQNRFLTTVVYFIRNDRSLGDKLLKFMILNNDLTLMKYNLGYSKSELKRTAEFLVKYNKIDFLKIFINFIN